MKKVSLYVMLLAVMMFVSVGTSFAQELGAKAVTISGSTGVSIGDYYGIQETDTIGLQGTDASTSHSSMNMRGTTIGTYADGSVATVAVDAGGYDENVGNVSGHGNFNSYVSGGCNAHIGDVHMTGSYSSHSNIDVHGSI